MRERVMPVGAPPLSPSADRHHVAPGEARRALSSGLMPLAVVVVCVAATAGLTVVARHLLAGSSFFATQRACVIVLAGGSIVSALLYATAGIRACAPSVHGALRLRCPARVVAMHTDMRVRTTEAWGTTIEFRARMIYLVRKGLR
jgi:hypothetical protein